MSLQHPGGFGMIRYYWLENSEDHTLYSGLWERSPGEDFLAPNLLIMC